MKDKLSIFIDPSYDIFSENRLFDLSNPILNRDNQLMPFQKIKKFLELQQISLHTADYLYSHDIDGLKYYYSIGLQGYKNLSHQTNLRLKAFLILEPPLVAPNLYKSLPELTKLFEEVYLHNIIGDQYSLDGVDCSKLKKLYIDQPFPDVLESYWSNTLRLNKIVAISGNQNPKLRRPEFYSLRIDAMLELANFNCIDLYGQGWSDLFSKKSLWLKYLINRGALLKIYKGTCTSKHKVLSEYKYALCLENMPMKGYITEKIFDCFYSGTVPIYLGAPDINCYIPKDCYIDVRDYSGWSEIWMHLQHLPDESWLKMRNSARDFLLSGKGQLFHGSYEKIICRDHDPLVGD